MAKSVGSFILHRLVEWGIERVYGYPGDGINGIIAALRDSELDAKLKFVQARHEEMAAFMACAHAKFTGDVGVCLATSGPGAIHLLNGLYDAKMDHQPVVAIVGQAATTAMGGIYQQEVDLASLFKDVAHEYCQTVMSPESARHVLDMAIRTAKAERTVTCVIVPKDLQEEAFAEPPHKHNTIHSSPGWSSPRVIPQARDLKRAAEVLNAGKRVAMLIGAGALRAPSEVTEVADLLGAGVAKALLGKAALPDALPWVTGSIGLLGTKPSWDLMQECDTLLMVGSSFPYAEFLPKDGQARAVQIDIDGRMLGFRYPMEVNLCGDSAETLRALIPLLQRKSDRSFREKIEKQVIEWWKLLDRRAHEPASPINPELVFTELSPRLPDHCIITSDSGSAATWFARDLKIREGMMASLSGNLATMGPGVPYAIGAKFAFPDRPVIALVGDGAMQMNGNGELLTVGKYWREWKNPQLIVLVLNNRDLNQVTWELRAMAGDPMLPQTQSLPDFDYAGYAEKCGLAGIRVQAPEGVGPAWDAALKADRPCVLEAVVDPNVPPLPPHISFEQAKAFTATLLKHDPHQRGIITQAFRELFSEEVVTMDGRGPTVEQVSVQASVIPTDQPESDGTIEWRSTTIVIVEVAAGGRRGLGWSYGSRATAEVVNETLAPCVRGTDAFAMGKTWNEMLARCRNLGRPGAAMMAISAVDIALWDLHSRLLEVPLTVLLGRVRDRVPIYGSGGFTSYDESRLRAQLAGWVEAGIPRVKMKVGRAPEDDPRRVAAAREAIGMKAELLVDANGAYHRQQAAALAVAFGRERVSWFEEPVSSDDLPSLCWLRERVPPGMRVAAGEYGFDPWYFNAMLRASAVDVIQADATRCGGFTGFLRAAAIADGFQIPLSTHCAPGLHAHAACAVPRLEHVEYFHDHARVERILFDGVLEPVAGELAPDLSRPGLGLTLKRKEAARHAA